MTTLLVLLFGCDSQPPALRVGTYPFVGFEPLFLGRDTDRIPDDQLRLVEYVNQQQVKQALIDGVIDAGTLTLDEALQVVDLDPSFKLAWVTDYCKGAYFILARAGIDDLAALKGRRVALDDSALGAHLLRRALERVNLRVEDVETQAMSPAEQSAALARGEVDAVVAFDPLQHAGATSHQVLFDSTQIPIELSGVLMVRADRIDDPRFARLHAAWDQAIQFVETDPAQAAAKMASRLHATNEQVQAGITKTEFLGVAESSALVSAQNSIFREVAERMKETLVASGKLSRDTSIAALFSVASDAGN